MPINLANSLFVQQLMYQQQQLERERARNDALAQQRQENQFRVQDSARGFMEQYDKRQQQEFDRAVTLAKMEAEAAGKSGKEAPKYGTEEQNRFAQIGFNTGDSERRQAEAQLAKEQAEFEYKQKHDTQNYNLADDKAMAEYNIALMKLEQDKKLAGERNKVIGSSNLAAIMREQRMARQQPIDANTKLAKMRSSEIDSELHQSDAILKDLGVSLDKATGNYIMTRNHADQKRQKAAQQATDYANSLISEKNKIHMDLQNKIGGVLGKENIIDYKDLPGRPQMQYGDVDELGVEDF